jgi:hypothetical protein
MVSLHKDSFEERVSSAFGKIKADVSSLRSTIDSERSNNHRLRENYLQNQRHFLDWIRSFEANIASLEKRVGSLEASISGRLSELELRQKEIDSLLKAGLDAQQKAFSALKLELAKELSVFSQIYKLKPISEAVKPVNNVDNANNVNNVALDPNYSALSNPEKWLVGVLFNAEAPLSYAQIADRTGKTISTVRVYMNQLKLKGFVEESSLPNGIKIFGLKHKAKVKALYNL